MPGVDALERVLQRRRRRAPLSGFFKADLYLALHQDLVSVDPLRHYTEYGVWEGRDGATSEQTAARLGQAAAALAEISPPNLEAMRRGYVEARNVRPFIYLPERANETERAVADRIATALDLIAVPAPVRAGTPAATGMGAILIHPHRLYSKGLYVEPAALADAVVVTTAKPWDEDFKLELPYLLGARGAIATEPAICALLQAADVPAALLAGLYGEACDEDPPAGHPLFRGLTRDIRQAPPHAPWADRPIDVVALEPISEARSAAWGRMASAMSDHRTIVYQPLPGAVSPAEETAMRRYLYARSKMVLHLHETTAAAQGARLVEEVAAAGAVLIGEPSPPHPFLRAGVHYFEASARRMPALVNDLLSGAADVPRPQTAIGAMRRALRPFCDLETTGLAIVNLLASSGTEP